MFVLELDHDISLVVLVEARLVLTLGVDTKSSRRKPLMHTLGAVPKAWGALPTSNINNEISLSILTPNLLEPWRL
jgi:hypothetical protein